MAVSHLTFSTMEKTVYLISLVYFSLIITYASYPEQLHFYGEIGSFFNYFPTNKAVIDHFIGLNDFLKARAMANVYAFFWIIYSVLLIILALVGLILSYGKIHEETVLHQSERDKQKQAYRSMIPFFSFAWLAFSLLAATQGDCRVKCIYLSNADFHESSNYLFVSIHLAISLLFFGFTIISILRVKNK